MSPVSPVFHTVETLRFLLNCENRCFNAQPKSDPYPHKTESRIRHARALFTTFPLYKSLLTALLKLVSTGLVKIDKPFK